MKKIKLVLAACLISLLAACSQNGGTYTEVPVTMSEVSEKMDNGESFVLLVEREECPFCEALKEYIESTKDDLKQDVTVYVLDSTNFELMREQEGDMTLVSETPDGQALLSRFPFFLYTPTAYEIKDGTPVEAALGFDQSNGTFSLWDVNSTIDWDSAQPVDVWEFLSRPAANQPADVETK